MKLQPRGELDADAYLARPVPADPELLKAYYAQVSSYQDDRVRSAKQTGRIGFLVGGLGALLALAGVGTAAFLAPLKTVVPLVFRVDNATGAVERVYDIHGGSMAVTEATSRYFLWQYVRLRQGYDIHIAQHDYETVPIMSTPPVAAEYVAAFRGTNPISPQVVLGSDGTSTVNWKSTAFLGPKLAQIRFIQIEQKPGLVLAPKFMVATIAFDFVSGPVPESVSNSNPLGFVVTSYRVDPEAA